MENMEPQIEKNEESDDFFIYAMAGTLMIDFFAVLTYLIRNNYHFTGLKSRFIDYGLLELTLLAIFTAGHKLKPRKGYSPKVKSGMLKILGYAAIFVAELNALYLVTKQDPDAKQHNTSSVVATVSVGKPADSVDYLTQVHTEMYAVVAKGDLAGVQPFLDRFSIDPKTFIIQKKDGKSMWINDIRGYLKHAIETKVPLDITPVYTGDSSSPGHQHNDIQFLKL